MLLFIYQFLTIKEIELKYINFSNKGLNCNGKLGKNGYVKLNGSLDMQQS